MPDNSCGKIAIKALKLVTMLDGLQVITLGGKTATRDVHIYGSNPRWTKNLQTFGEAGVVKEGKDGKTGNRGIAMVFCGYPYNRESDSMRMWNPGTNRVVTTSDVIWLKRMYYERSDEDAEMMNMVDRMVNSSDDAQEDEDENIIPELEPSADVEAEADTTGAGENDNTIAPAATGTVTRSRQVVQ